MKPATDLCFECQENTSLLMKAANMPESMKSKRISHAQKHISLAQMQRQHYNDHCEQAKRALEVNETNPSYMHYSFDFAQQIHFPYSSQQPGQLFFRTPRKCGIFGVACEAKSCQINYLIDEADHVGKGANTTVSLVNDYLEKYSYKEPHLLLHADNCVGQNKNNTFIQYLMWRIITKRSRTINLSFMLAGHTKFAPDRFFGLFKRQFRRATVDTLQDIVRVMRESSTAGKNNPQLTVDPTGSREVEWYDWSSFFSLVYRPIPKIMKGTKVLTLGAGREVLPHNMAVTKM